MARVIVRKTWPKKYAYIVDCSRCTSTIEFDENDKTEDENEPYDVPVVMCPVCNYSIDWNNVTKRFKEKIEREL